MVYKLKIAEKLKNGKSEKKVKKIKKMLVIEKNTIFVVKLATLTIYQLLN